MLAAYADLKKEFVSVHREAMWDPIYLCGIFARIIGLLTGLYCGTVSDENCGGFVYTFFPVNKGVRQGYVLGTCHRALHLFNI